jgi:hypothetical protein
MLVHDAKVAIGVTKVASSTSHSEMPSMPTSYEMP